MVRPAALEGIESPGDLTAIDRHDVRDLIGEDAERDLDALDDLAKVLEEAGYLERHGERMELTARGARQIGRKVLDDLFARLRKDAFGGHRVERAGRGGEPEETAKPFALGVAYEPGVAITFRVDEVYVQTPGPGAGSRMA